MFRQHWREHIAHDQDSIALTMDSKEPNTRLEVKVPLRWKLNHGYGAELKTGSAALLAAIALGLSARVYADAGQSSVDQPPSHQQVIAFLLQSVDWYRHMAAERRIVTESGEFVFPDDNRVTAVQILRLSFEFAKAEAALARNSATSGSQLATSPSVDASSDIAHFIDLKNQTAHAIQNATQEVGELKKRVGRARGTDRTRLQAALDEAQSRLELLTARFSSIQTLANFAQSTAGGKSHGDDLASTIDDLAQTLPELSNAANSFMESQDPNFRPSSNTQQSGILGTWAEVSTLKRKLSIIDEATRLTDALALSAQSVRQPADAFRTRLIRSCVLGDPETDDLSRLRARKAELDTLTAELNLWSPAIVALDKQKILLALYKSHHAYWRSTLDERYRQAWKKLVIRVLIVLLIMALLAGIGEFSRRVTLRHIQDPNRRRRLAVGQRVLILLMVLLVAAFSLASDLSSLATFLALVTAGLAVALQNVILASLGYLLLVGRLGIRIGDLVQISGVTGYVSDIGLLQFQLSEFDAQRRQFTGHVATFSNSLVFVSPATALVKFNADDHLAKPEASNMNLELDPSQRKSAASAL